MFLLYSDLGTSIQFIRSVISISSVIVAVGFIVERNGPSIYIAFIVYQLQFILPIILLLSDPGKDLIIL